MIETTVMVNGRTLRTKIAVRKGRKQMFQFNGDLCLVTVPSKKAAQAYFAALKGGKS